MLVFVLFAPLATAFGVLALPPKNVRAIRSFALGGSLATLAATVGLFWGSGGGADLEWRIAAPWVPAIGASFDVAVDGLSLPLVGLTALVFVLVFLFVLGDGEHAKAHAFLLLFMETGILGVFCAQDLLLFYLFFEVALVPMYFLIGVFGSEGRRYAAVKFFLYTRAGSLLMLIGFLVLFGSMEPRTFSIPEIVAAEPLAGSPRSAALVFFCLLVGFGVKLPIWPLHNWLPDAHVEAPTEGSVVLAALQLKMGGYGILRVLLPSVPAAVERYAWLLLALALVSLFWGVFAALAQTDFKRLVAYTSINHMGFVLLGAGLAAVSGDAAARALALDGASLQLVSHGLLTGGMFFLAGILQHQAGTREIERLGGLLRRLPIFSFLLVLLAFGSLGLPGFSGFVAELQVIGAAVAVSPWIGAAAVVGLVVTTGLYLKVLDALVLGKAPEGARELREPPLRDLLVVACLAIASLAIGIFPAPLVSMIHAFAASGM